ncbi:MAG: Veg family protein [Clostridiales bacterium]|nr:Veg family protein [Clostridiales bacterium]
MKEVKHSLDDAKNRLFGLKGLNVMLRVNLGRNKIVEYNGRVENLYASVFTVKSEADAIKTYSYSDVLTGNVKFFNRTV